MKVRVKPGFDADIHLTEKETILLRLETGLVTEAEANKQLLKLDWSTVLGCEDFTRNKIKQLVSHLM